MRDIKPDKRSSGDVMLPDLDRYPHFNIEIKHLSEAKKWEIGKEYIITLKLKMTGLSINERRDGKESGYVDFDIRGIDPHKKKKNYKLLYKD